MANLNNPIVTWENVSKDFKTQATQLLKQIAEEAQKQMGLHWQKKRDAIEKTTLESLIKLLETLRGQQGTHPTNILAVAKVEDSESLDKEDHGSVDSRQNIALLLESTFKHFRIEQSGTDIFRNVNCAWLVLADFSEEEEDKNEDDTPAEPE